MFNAKNKFNFKKLYITIISLFIIFSITTPNFASAIKEPFIKPVWIFYDVKNDGFFSYAGRIFDQNIEEIKWQLGESPIFANIRVNDELVTKIEVPFYFLIFIDQLADEGYGETQRICYSNRLENWLKHKIKPLFKFYNHEDMSIEINAELSSMVEGTRCTSEGRLCEITIKNEYIPPYKGVRHAHNQENSSSFDESGTSSNTTCTSST